MSAQTQTPEETAPDAPAPEPQNAKKRKQSFAEELAERIVEQLKTGTAPWQKQWTTTEQGRAPYNPITGSRYRGGNFLQLMMRGHDDPRWMTYKQAEAAGYQVRKGQRGARLQFWVFEEERTVTDAQGKPVLDENGKPTKETVALDTPYPVSFVVFNAQQIEGIPPLPAPENPITEFQANERAERIAQALNVPVRHDSMNRCYYSPAEDEVHLVPRQRFHSEADYYDTLLHELAHSTGHESRLGRFKDGDQSFGSEGYAREELRAEIASWMMGVEIGLPRGDFRALSQNNAAYVKDWIQVLHDTPLEIVRACRDADKITQYVLEQEKKLTIASNNDLSTPKVDKSRAAAPVAADGPVFAKAAPVAYDTRATAALAAHFAKAIEAAAKNAPDDAEWRFSLDETYDKKAMLEYASGGKLAARLQANLERGHGAKCARDWFLDAKDYEAAVADAPAKTSAAKEAAAGVIPPGPGDKETADRRYLYCPYHEKEELKEVAQAANLQPLWDRQAKKWSIPMDIDPAPFAKWLQPRENERKNEKSEKTEKVREPKLRQGKTCYFNVPENKAEAVKAAGAEFDPNFKMWRAEEGTYKKIVEEILTSEDVQAQGKAKDKRVYCFVPYTQRDAFHKDCEAANAKHGYDWHSRRWYVVATDKADMTKIAGWLRMKGNAQDEPPQPRLSPREELTEAMKGIGIVVEGEHPIMDGLPHRIGVEGKPHGQDGYYRAFADGHPNAYFMNHRTGEAKKWLYSGYAAPKEDRAKALEENAAKLAQRQAEIEAAHAAVAQEVAHRLATMQTVTEAKECPAYLARKGCLPHPGTKVDADNNLVVPVYGADGNVQTMQTINAEGDKRFARGGKMRGGFHAIDGQHTLNAAKMIVICEGWATAASIREATGLPTVAAFNCRNLQPVAESIRESHPDAQIVIAGDDDTQTKGNPGRAAAAQAAAAVNGLAVFPYFPHVDAMEKPGTDFNDLANAVGLDAMARQFASAVNVQISKQPNEREQAATQAQEREAAKMERSRRHTHSLGMAM